MSLYTPFSLEKGPLAFKYKNIAFVLLSEASIDMIVFHIESMDIRCKTPFLNDWRR